MSCLLPAHPPSGAWLPKRRPVNIAPLSYPLAPAFVPRSALRAATGLLVPGRIICRTNLLGWSSLSPHTQGFSKDQALMPCFFLLSLTAQASLHIPSSQGLCPLPPPPQCADPPGCFPLVESVFGNAHPRRPRCPSLFLVSRPSLHCSLPDCGDPKKPNPFSR
jgi:hypothetical protein